MGGTPHCEIDPLLLLRLTLGVKAGHIAKECAVPDFIACGARQSSQNGCERIFESLTQEVLALVLLPQVCLYSFGKNSPFLFAGTTRDVIAQQLANDCDKFGVLTRHWKVAPPIWGHLLLCGRSPLGM